MHHREEMKSRYVVSQEELVQMGMEGKDPCYLRELVSTVVLLFGRQVEEKRKKDETK